MCGRFVLFSSLDDILQSFEVDVIHNDVQASYNVAPSQPVTTIVREGEGNVLRNMTWGLIPFWAKDRAIGSRMINARAETVHQKPSFKRPFADQRCLVLADGFFEWQKTDEGKQPVYIHLKSEKPFGLAGLYDRWTSPEGEMVQSCTIITTEPNELLRPIHNRMPVILPATSCESWLDPVTSDVETLQAMLKPFPAGEMAYYPVSKLVNSPKNNSPDCIRPLADPS